LITWAECVIVATGELGDDRPSRCWDMAIYQFSKWLPSAILDFWKFKILHDTV